ncbi:hypothetical protein [Variovorax sp. R-27]|uniref:hypothetical protein n=1 Tax=Variovorax sp. R-27 TaxID=3404058 RepID=UPI003CF63984
MSDASEVALAKLVQIYSSAGNGTKKQIAAIEALGRLGGGGAVKALIKIYDSAGNGTGRQIAAILAIGEAGRLMM